MRINIPRRCNDPQMCMSNLSKAEQWNENVLWDIQYNDYTPFADASFCV